MKSNRSHLPGRRGFPTELKYSALEHPHQDLNIKKLPYFYKILNTINDANCMLQRLQEESSLCFWEKKKNPRSSVSNIIDIDLSTKKLLTIVQELKQELHMLGRRDQDTVSYLSHVINTFETKLQGLIQHLTQFKTKQHRRCQLNNNNSLFSLGKSGNYSQPYKQKIGANRSIKNEFKCGGFKKKNISNNCDSSRDKYFGNTTTKRRSISFSQSKLCNQHSTKKKNNEVPLDELSESCISFRSHGNGRRKIPIDKFNVLPTYCNKSNRGINDCHGQKTYCVKSWNKYCKNKSCYVENGHSYSKRVDKYTTKRPTNETKTQRGCRNSSISLTGRESLNAPLKNEEFKLNQGYKSRTSETYNKGTEVFKHKTLNQEYNKHLNQHNVNNQRRLRSGRSNYKTRSRGRKLSVCFHSSRQLPPKEQIKSREHRREKHIKNKHSSGSSVRTDISTHDKTKGEKHGMNPEKYNIWHLNTHARNLNVYRSSLDYSPKFERKRNIARRNSSSSRSQIDNTLEKGRVRKHIAYSPRQSSNNSLKNDSYYNEKRSRRKFAGKCKTCNDNRQSSSLTTHECRDCDGNNLKKDAYSNVKRSRHRSTRKSKTCNDNRQSSSLTTHECCGCDPRILSDRNTLKKDAYSNVKRSRHRSTRKCKTCNDNRQPSSLTTHECRDCDQNNLKRDAYSNVKRSRHRLTHKCKTCNDNRQPSSLTTDECRDCDPRISRNRNTLKKYSYYSVNRYRPRSLHKCKTCNVNSQPSTHECCDYCILRERNRGRSIDHKIPIVDTETDYTNESNLESTPSSYSEQSSFTCTEEQTLSDFESDQCESEDLKRNQRVKYLYLRKKSKPGKHNNSFNILGKDTRKNVVEYDVLPTNKYSTTGTNTESARTCSKNTSTVNLKKIKAVGTNTNNRCYKEQGTNPDRTTLPDNSRVKKNECTNTNKTNARNSLLSASKRGKKDNATNPLCPTNKREAGTNPLCVNEVVQYNVSAEAMDLKTYDRLNCYELFSTIECQTDPETEIIALLKKPESKRTKLKDKKRHFVDVDKLDIGLNVMDRLMVDAEMQSENILTKPDIEYKETYTETDGKFLQKSSIDKPSQREKDVQTVQKETKSQGINPDNINMIEQNVQTEVKDTLSRGVSPHKFKGFEKDIQTVGGETISRGIGSENVDRDEREMQNPKKEAVSRGVNPDRISQYDKDAQTVRMDTFSRAVDTNKILFVDKNIQVPQIVPTPSTVTQVDYVEETKNTDSATELSMHLIFEKCHEDIYKRSKNNYTTRNPAFQSDDFGQRNVNFRRNTGNIHENTQNNQCKTSCHNEKTCFRGLLKQVSSENTTYDRREIYNNDKVTRNIRIIIDKTKRKRNDNLDNSMKYGRTVPMDEDSGFADSNASYSNCTLDHYFWQNIADEIKDDYHIKVR